MQHSDWAFPGKLCTKLFKNLKDSQWQFTLELVHFSMTHPHVSHEQGYYLYMQWLHNMDPEK